MIYFSGDIHGSPWGVKRFCDRNGLTESDIVVLLGDVGANYYGNILLDKAKIVLAQLRPTILCIHGNHEIRPHRLDGYRLREWNGGKVWVQDYLPSMPSLLFAKDGEIYNLNGLRYLAIGGAYSVDKYYRLNHGMAWWPDEQPDEETKAFVERQIAENRIDVVLSHTCPYKYVPREMFLSGIDQCGVDSSTELWLDSIEDRLDYRAWFCGHWHTDKRIDRMHFLFHSFESEDDIPGKQG